MAKSIVVNGTSKRNAVIQYGKLTRIGPWFRIGNGQASVFQCECGEVTVCRRASVETGGTISCGCYRRSSHKTSNAKHGFLKSAPAEYVAYRHMIERCRNPKCSRFKNYGGRGIKVCERWLESVENFVADMGLRPSPKHSIDRINNDGDYTPENCRWALDREQANNTTRNRRLTLNGKTMTVMEWSRQPGVTVRQNTIYCRLADGWTPERAVFEPVRK